MNEETYYVSSEACLVQAAGWEKTKGCTPMAGFIASANCADAIREKIKELK